MAETRERLAGRPRTVFGKKVRFLRRAGWTPANVFGPGAPSVPIEVQTRDFEHLMGHGAHSSLLSLEIEGQPEATVMIKAVARKPTTDEAYHVDFYRVSMTRLLQTEVALVFVGEAPAVDLSGATVLRELGALSIECLPGDLPRQIEVDLARLVEVGDAVHVRDLVMPQGVKCLADVDLLIVHAVAREIQVEEVEEEEAKPPEEAEKAKEPSPQEGTP